MSRIVFTSNEIKIIKLLCKEFTAKEIAAKTGLSFRTVESYKRTIQKKIKARGTVGIAIYAIKNGILNS